MAKSLILCFPGNVLAQVLVIQVHKLVYLRDITFCTRRSKILLPKLKSQSQINVWDYVSKAYIFVEILHIPNGCFDAYEVKVNKDIFQYQEKVKLITQFQRFILFFNGFLHSHKIIVKII